MKLEGIIHISGKPGLYKIISQASKTIIIESLIDQKRIPLYSHQQVNMLEEISIYTNDDTKPLNEIFLSISKKEKTKSSISHKSSKNELLEYFRQILPEYDEDRVYVSDIKKIIQWYNILQSKGYIKNEKKKNNKK
tara:strand:+ start:356 stop:763 length:408 start_codon:yes stop_codon:yes gene_type:complete